MQQEYLQYMHKDGTLICYNVKPSFILGSLASRPWQNKGKCKEVQIEYRLFLVNVPLNYAQPASNMGFIAMTKNNLCIVSISLGKWKIEILNRNRPMLNIRLHLKTVVLSGSLVPQQSKVIVLAIETRYILSYYSIAPQKRVQIYRYWSFP